MTTTDHVPLARYTYLQAKAANYADTLHLASKDDEDNIDDARDALYLEVVVLLQPCDDGSGLYGDTYRVEFVLELNGPTTRIIVDSRWGVTIESSDGPGPHASYSYVSVDVDGDTCRTFEAEAEHYVEVWR